MIFASVSTPNPGVVYISMFDISPLRADGAVGARSPRDVGVYYVFVGCCAFVVTDARFTTDHDVIIGQLCAKWLTDGGLAPPP